MYISLIAGLLLIGVAAALATRALATGRVQAAERLRSIEMYGFGAQQELLPAIAAAPGGVLSGLAERIGAAAATRARPVDLNRMRRDLLGAGHHTVTTETYLGYRVLLAAGTGTLLLLLLLANPNILLFLALIVGLLLAWRLPMVVVHRRAVERCAQIDRDLPELIDLLVVSVEAGVGLAGALQMIATRMSGPLGVELRLMLHEQTLGLSNDHSLSNLLDRVDTPSVRSFVRSLQQGERLGVSIGTIMRNLAIEMRTRRRQNAEEQAQKAPVKILFPLIFLIFPAMLIVLAYPIIHTVKEAFG
ncbi:MAG: tight adherence protein [Solirubrobacteraceae bacterium]|nr:tight adherence protein [Solirubrobacteraceae bacterium]